jgi:Raf kinase inhibitor-like YbhB/YbcL family protein
VSIVCAGIESTTRTEDVMKLWSDTFTNGQPIPERCAFGKHHAEQHVELTENKNPHLAWSDLPTGTKSLVLICHDSDVPSKPDNVNREGVTVPADLPRVGFYHWVLVDLAPDVSSVAEGEFSDGITAKGKSGPPSARGTRQGLNNYTQWFAGDADMGGTYFGYDGPCPPWNDEIVHHYHFTLFALDVDTLPVTGEFGGDDVRKAMQGHVLGQVSIAGTYHINPNARLT